MIRPATSDDFENILALHFQLIEHLVKSRPSRYQLNKELEKQSFRESFDNYLSNPLARILVFEEKKIVGYIIGKIKSSETFLKDTKYGYLHEVAVDKKYRRKGIGTKLADELIKFFKKNQIAHIEAFVDSANVESLSAWKKHGFSPDLVVLVKEI